MIDSAHCETTLGPIPKVCHDELVGRTGTKPMRRYVDGPNPIAIALQVVDQMTSNKPGGTGYENPRPGHHTPSARG